MSVIPAGMERIQTGDSDFSDDDFIMQNYGPEEKVNSKEHVPILRSYESEDIPCSRVIQNDQIPKVQVEKPPVEERRSLHIESGEILDDLRVAVMQGDLELVRTLFSKGIKIDCVLKSGWTALMYACSLGNHEVAHYLLTNEADPNFHKDKFTPLMAACASRKVAESNFHLCVKYLLEFGAEVNVWERHLMTPLMFAAREGRPTIVKELVQAEADVNRQDNRGWTALTWAASRGFGQVVRILIDSKADCGVLSTSGQTAADVAYSFHHDTLGEILEKVILSHDKILDLEDKQMLQSWRQPSKNGLSPENNSQREYVQYGQLEIFLCGLNVKHLIPLFHQQQITFHDLLVITEEDLEKMGIDQLGVRKKIVDNVRDVHKKQWERGSLPNLRKNKCISCPDAVSLMGNISQHLSYIERSVTYIRCELQRHPRILELGQEAASVHRLLKETEESERFTQRLKDELRFFKKHLEKVQDNVEYIPADLIVERTLTSREKYSLKRRASIVLVVAGTAAVGIILWRRPLAFYKLLHVPQSWHSISV